MRYLILSDIHSNLTALEAVLAQAGDDYDRVVCLGDIVGYGPDPNEVVDRVRALDPVAVVRGNHDKAGCGIDDAEDFNPVARDATVWTREQLRSENLTYLRQLDRGPLRVGDFQVVHGSLRDEDEYVFMPLEAQQSLEQAEAALVFCGHTHFQGGFVLGQDGGVAVLDPSPGSGAASSDLPLEAGLKYLVNPGSIGQPRDGDARAAFGFYDDRKRVVEYWRVPYDIKATQERMQQAGLPEPLILRLALGR